MRIACVVPWPVLHRISVSGSINRYAANQIISRSNVMSEPLGGRAGKPLTHSSYTTIRGQNPGRGSIMDATVVGKSFRWH
jgi:hypothetical protein